MAHKGEERALIPCIAYGTITAGRGVKLYQESAEAIYVQQCDSAGEFCWGVAEDSATDGQHVTVAKGGRVKGLAGATVTFGGGATVDANGKFTDVDGSNDYHCGIFVSGGDADEWVTIDMGSKILDQDGQ